MEWKVRSQRFCPPLPDKNRNYKGIWSNKRKSFVARSTLSSSDVHVRPPLCTSSRVHVMEGIICISKKKRKVNMQSSREISRRQSDNLAATPLIFFWNFKYSPFPSFTRIHRLHPPRFFLFLFFANAIQHEALEFHGVVRSLWICIAWQLLFQEGFNKFVGRTWQTLNKRNLCIYYQVLHISKWYGNHDIILAYTCLYWEIFQMQLLVSS